MTNELMLAATAFFALGALDYAYRMLNSIYYDIKSALRERAWRKKIKSAEATPTVDASPVAI